MIPTKERKHAARLLVHAASLLLDLPTVEKDAAALALVAGALVELRDADPGGVVAAEACAFVGQLLKRRRA